MNNFVVWCLQRIFVCRSLFRAIWYCTAFEWLNILRTIMCVLSNSIIYYFITKSHEANAQFSRACNIAVFFFLNSSDEFQFYCYYDWTKFSTRWNDVYDKWELRQFFSIHFDRAHSKFTQYLKSILSLNLFLSLSLSGLSLPSPTVSSF